MGGMGLPLDIRGDYERGQEYGETAEDCRYADERGFSFHTSDYTRIP